MLLLLLLLCMLQAKKCYDTSKSGKAACDKMPYCVYDSKGSICYRRMFDYADNDYERTVGRLNVSETPSLLYCTLGKFW
jgi:hypothetical protein